MMECKKALAASDDDVEQALTWLRSHSTAKLSDKLSGRDADEGLVGLRLNEHGSAGVVVKVASETDFAGRSETFARLIEDVARAALDGGSGVDTGAIDVSDDAAFWDRPVQKNETATVRTAVDEAVLSIRENLQLQEAHRVASSTDGVVAGYVHGKAPHSVHAGTAAAIVELGVLSGDSDDATKTTASEVGRRLAMHVVAAKPDWLSPDHVPEDVLEQERAVLMEQMADSGKPSNILDKIVAGRLRKFYESVCLTEQAHMVEEGNPKVSTFLKEHGLEIRSFKSVAV